MNTAKKCFVTALFAGYIPAAPGTFGTLVAFAACCALLPLPSSTAIALVIALFAVILYPAIRFSTEAERHFGTKDPEQVVIDEVLGYLLTIMFHPVSLPLLAAAFVLFRFFDILKPFPVNRVQKLKGGVGVVVDDLVAGVFANLVLTVLVFASRHAGAGLL